MSNTGAVIFQLLLNEQNTKPVSGRPFAAREGGRGRDGAAPVVGLIAAGQVDDGFRPMLLLVERKHDGIGQHVVDEART
jgi:hypothetical protein